jgi:beta-glucosidase
MKALQILKNSILVLLSLLSILSLYASEHCTVTRTNDIATPTVPLLPGIEIWKDPSQPVDVRVRDLIGQLSRDEKVLQLRADAPAIPRLGIPAYSFRNECLHGVSDDATAAVFPEPIGMAATWDMALIQKEADCISTEARARFNDYTSKHNGNSATHCGISFYAPNINIFRDPRWGRGQETYGEDPFLTAQMGIAFIRGLQGDDPRYLKTIACAKHYVVHSGPEPLRQHFNATPPQRDFYETYLPAFESAVREGHVGSVMGAYNALDGIPDCVNPFLLTKLLRQEWGFKGFIVSDGDAIRDIWDRHKYVKTPEEAVVAAVKAGCDLFSGEDDHFLIDGSSLNNLEVLKRVSQHQMLSEKEIDDAVSYTLAARFQLGLFDPPSMVPWSKIGNDRDDKLQDPALALKVAEESIVLLRNTGVLPLDRSKIRHIAVVGANADSEAVLLGNYSGTPSDPVTILDGIRQIAGTNIEVTFTAGCPLALKNDNSNQPTPETTRRALAAAKRADVVIYVGGLDSSLEREEGKVDYKDFLGGDRTRIELPQVQENLLKMLYATGRPIVFVNCSGSAIAMQWENQHLPAIVQTWYPGEQGGNAVAEVLFGNVNPSGRLPVTFYSSTTDLPPFEDYAMSNRTYRYFTGKPLFAFGYGLSYTGFKYSDPKLDSKTVAPDGKVHVMFMIKNTGARDGDEVAQVYFRHGHSAVPQPKEALCGFARVHVAKGDTASVTVDIPAERFRYWNTTQQAYVVEPGDYELLVGGASNDIRLWISFQVVDTFYTKL